MDAPAGAAYRGHWPGEFRAVTIRVAGSANVATISVYLDVAAADDSAVGNLFDFDDANGIERETVVR